MSYLLPRHQNKTLMSKHDADIKKSQKKRRKIEYYGTRARGQFYNVPGASPKFSIWIDNETASRKKLLKKRLLKALEYQNERKLNNKN